VSLKARSSSEINHLLEQEQAAGLIFERFTLPFEGFLPYPPSSKIVSDVSGEFEYQGRVYQFVRSEIYKDTITYTVVRNNKGTQINNVFEEYAQKTTGKPFHQGKQTTFLPILSKYYFLSYNLAQILFGEVINQDLYTTEISHYQSLFQLVDSPPPEC
jgi:hypothetical protein